MTNTMIKKHTKTNIETKMKTMTKKKGSKDPSHAIIARAVSCKTPINFKMIMMILNQG